MGVSVNRGEDSEAKSGENEKAEENKKGQIFEGARAVIVGDLKIWRLVFFSCRCGSYRWVESWVWFG